MEFWTLAVDTVAQCIDDLTTQSKLGEAKLHEWKGIVDKDYGGAAEVARQRTAANELRERCEASEQVIENNWGVRYAACLDPEYLNLEKLPSKHLHATTHFNNQPSHSK